MLKYLSESKGYPWDFRPACHVATADHLRGTLGRAFLDAVAQVEEATASSAGRRHSAGGERRQRRLDLRTTRLLLLLLLLLSVEFDGVLSLERVQVGDGLRLQVDVDPWQLLVGSVHGLRGELLPGVMCGHLLGGDS